MAIEQLGYKTLIWLTLACQEHRPQRLYEVLTLDDHQGRVITLKICLRSRRLVDEFNRALRRNADQNEAIESLSKIYCSLLGLGSNAQNSLLNSAIFDVAADLVCSEWNSLYDEACSMISRMLEYEA